MSYTPKGLATVALLKTRLDEGHDHLNLFEPLVRDALVHAPNEDFNAVEIQTVLKERSGILVPSDTLKTLLGRFARRGTLGNAGGRFCLRERPQADVSIDRLRTDIRSQQQTLGNAFVRYAADDGLTLGTPDAALDILATVASENKVRLVLDEPLPDSPLDHSLLPRKTTRIAARFITQQCLDSPSLRPALQSLVEGILLHDALFMCDNASASQRFQRLTVALDTRILFSALDLAGGPGGLAAREGLSLLREAGARTVAFDQTVDEMRRVLAFYEDRLATPSGIATLRQTDLRRHFLSAHYSPSDIRILSATLDTRLEAVGVAIIRLPDHELRFTLDERLLAEMLTSDGEDPASSRVRHDVDAIAAVLTLRRGRSATAVERSVAVFCSSTGKVVRNAQKWYRGQEQGGIPPVIHQAALTSIAWLKKPAAAPGLKLHELVALCASAMRPTRATWTKFTENLRRLRDEGVIKDDETAAIVASELTEPLLARLDEESEPDAASIVDVIERVRGAYRREASVHADKLVRSARDDAASAQQAAEAAVRAAQAETTLAQQAASGALTSRDAALNALEAYVRTSSRRKASIAFFTIVAITVAAAVISIPGVFDEVGAAWKWVARAIFGFAAVLTVCFRVFGGSALAWRERLISHLVRRAKVPLLAESAIPADWCEAKDEPEG